VRKVIYKEKVKKEIIDMVNITIDEYCKKCKNCCEDSNCILTCINNGITNIYGNMFNIILNSERGENDGK